MQKNVWFILWTLFIFTALTFCKEDPSTTLKSGSEEDPSENNTALPTLTLVSIYSLNSVSAGIEGRITSLGKGC